MNLRTWIINCVHRSVNREYRIAHGSFFLSWGQGGSVCFPTNCSEEAWEGLTHPNHRQHIFSHLFLVVPYRAMQTVVSHAESQVQPSKLGSTLSTYIYKTGVSIHKTLYTQQTHPTIQLNRWRGINHQYMEASTAIKYLL